MKAVILVAGESTRTHPLTLTRPKPLLKMGNKTILEYLLEALRGLVDGVVLVVGYKGEMIEQTVGSYRGGLTIEYVWQQERLGTGHAVLQCAERVAGPFLVVNGDDLYDALDLRRLSQMPQALLAKRVSEPHSYGILEVGEGNRVLRLVEKPDRPVSDLANMGAYSFTPDIFDVLGQTKPSERGEIEITSAIQRLAERGEFRMVPAEGYWQPIVYPWHLLEANEFFLNTRLRHEIRGEVSPAAHITGPVTIGPDTIVRSGVVIDGPVCIGMNCSLGPNCWLRPGTTLGDGCRVGHAVEIKNSILMDGVTVAHLSYVGDSIVGEKANLGCGTVTANFRHDGAPIKSLVKKKAVGTGRTKLGAIIGDNVHTGVNTSIYPGRKLWPNTTTLPGTAVHSDIVD